MATDRYMDVDVFAEEPAVEEPYYPGTDPDGKERLPPFAQRFAAPSMEMEGIERPDGAERAKQTPGAVKASPFV